MKIVRRRLMKKKRRISFRVPLPQRSSKVQPHGKDYKRKPKHRKKLEGAD
jgi:hypothetical protein